jgi:hypothetical protein
MLVRKKNFFSSTESLVWARRMFSSTWDIGIYMKDNNLYYKVVKFSVMRSCILESVPWMIRH